MDQSLGTERFGHRDPGVLGQRVDQPLHGRLSLRGSGAPLAAVVGHPVLDAREPVGVEKPLQHVVTLLRRRVQEPLELALRQHRHLLELARLHADQVRHQLADLGRAMAEQVLAVRPHLGDGGLGLLGRGAVAAAFGPRPLGSTAYDETSLAHAEVEHHLGARIVGGVLRLQGLDAAHARDLAVEREADRVEDAGLAGAGRPGEQEQAGVVERVEVDVLGAGERSERGDGQGMQPHGVTPTRARR